MIIKNKEEKIMLPMIKNNILFSSIFDELFEDSNVFKGHSQRLPRVNISESENMYQVDFSVPGITKEDFKIEVNDNLLTVGSEQKEDKKEEDKNYYRREFYQYHFSRSFVLPDSIDANKIDASYKNGILEIKIPKKEMVEKVSKLIDIK